jgi:hypothetical protein
MVIPSQSSGSLYVVPIPPPLEVEWVGLETSYEQLLFIFCPQPSFRSLAKLSLFPHVDKALAGILLGSGKPETGKPRHGKWEIELSGRNEKA